MLRKASSAAIHAAFWLIYIVLYATVWRLPGMTFSESLAREVALLPFKVILVYTCIGYLVPRFLNEKRYGIFAGAAILLIVSGTVLHNTYVHFLPADLTAADPNESLLSIERLSKRMTYLTSPMLFALTLVVVRNWYVQVELNQVIRRENLAARNHLLRQKLQPHFFFNVLNSIYSLALQRSDQTAGMILKLSDLMRYLSDKSEREWVTLTEELAFINSFISLEEARFQDRVKVTRSISVAEPDRIHLPPLVLSAFIENAFKHGVNDTIRFASVDLSLNEDRQYLFYKVTNTKVPGRVLQPPGSGLSDLRSRLHLVYAQDFEMKSKETDEHYSALLKLPKKNANS